MTTQVTIKREVEKLKEKTGAKPKTQLRVELSNKLVRDWSNIIEKGPKRSVMLVEAKP